MPAKCAGYLPFDGVETYLLETRAPSDLELLVGSLRPNPSALDMDLIIGMRCPIATPDICNGLSIPIVSLDQVYSFDKKTLIESIPKPSDIDEGRFKEVAGELLDRVTQISELGASSAHRALNYLAVRYPPMYARAANAFASNFTLSGIDVSQSHLSGARHIVDVIFSFADRTSDSIEKSYVRVDVTEEFPFLVTKLSPYFDR